MHREQDNRVYKIRATSGGVSWTPDNWKTLGILKDENTPENRIKERVYASKKELQLENKIIRRDTLNFNLYSFKIIHLKKCDIFWREWKFTESKITEYIELWLILCTTSIVQLEKCSVF